MYLERTMYKLLVLSLGMILIGKALGLVSLVRNLFQVYSRQDVWPLSPTLFALLVQLGWVLFAAMMLYWIPKFIKQQFPEVA